MRTYIYIYICLSGTRAPRFFCQTWSSSLNRAMNSSNSGIVSCCVELGANTPHEAFASVYMLMIISNSASSRVPTGIQ